MPINKPNYNNPKFLKRGDQIEIIASARYFSRKELLPAINTIESFGYSVKCDINFDNKKDIFFMGFHPLNPANEEEQEFLVTPNGDTPIVESDLEYSMLLAQKFSQLQEASDKLHKSGYYKLWPRGYYQDVVVSRQKTYKRIFGGQHDG